MPGIGIDFGTTNSVIAVADDRGDVHALTWPSESGETPTYRTAIAFRPVLQGRERGIASAAGPQAIAWALDPAPNQRFVQSIKTHLGSRAFRESRILGKRFLLEEVIGLFLRHLTAEGRWPDGKGLEGVGLEAGIKIVAGRPVAFAGDAPDEALAVERLGKAFALAGMPNPDFAFEPLGAAYWYARDLDRPQTVLVGDFGGGTSDFSVMRFDQHGGALTSEALSHDGVGVAGDTFDYRIIDNVIAPQLGKQAQYRSFMKLLPVPQHFFAAFSRWHQLSWLKDAKVLADLDAISDTADDPEALQRLRTIIDHDLGLDLYGAVTAAKMQLSDGESAAFRFDRFGVKLDASIRRADFERWIAADLAAIDAAMQRALDASGQGDGTMDAVFLTGGTSYVPAVRALFTRRFGKEKVHIGNAFQSVAAGLALLALQRSNTKGFHN